MLRLPIELEIGLRYTRASRRSSRDSFISFISLISMAGIALGVAALIVVLSVMNGFQKEVRTRMLSAVARHSSARVHASLHRQSFGLKMLRTLALCVSSFCGKRCT